MSVGEGIKTLLGGTGGVRGTLFSSLQKIYGEGGGATTEIGRGGGNFRMLRWPAGRCCVGAVGDVAHPEREALSKWRMEKGRVLVPSFRRWGIDR